MMKREILFRGKNKHGKWYYGYYTEGYYLDGTPVSWIEVVDRKKKDTECPTVSPNTVGQFTGLTDKNGKRAFEHDVIKHHFGDEIGVIRYGEYRNPFGDDSHGGHVGFYVDWVSGTEPGLLRKDLAYWMKIVEIIGNIHDNPELLGGVGDG